ncbi:MAG TPA: hypothetical protein IAA78_02330 [Candidatus Avamphibacillus intestinigallinarum]|nr:hypothetical protein [Candidatus Avamphibacillus intestinigallinarum]
MKEFILMLANIVNNIHDVIIQIVGPGVTDKQLHFWVMGFIGMVIFIMVYIAFRIISTFRFSTGILSFIYTFTVMLVLVFAIEIQQALTSRGTMDFQDAVVGMYGFFIFFFVYTCIVAIGYLIKKLIFKK